MLQPQYEDPVEFLWNLAWGRHLSRFLGLAIELDALGKMGEEPITVAEASARWGLPETSARVLAQSLCCMRILVHEDGKLTKSGHIQDFSAVGDLLLEECRNPLESIDALREELQSPKPQAWYEIRDEAKAPEDVFTVDF